MEWKYPQCNTKNKVFKNSKKKSVLHFQALITLGFVDLSPKNFFAWPAMIAIIWTATFTILSAFEGL